MTLRASHYAALSALVLVSIGYATTSCSGVNDAGVTEDAEQPVRKKDGGAQGDTGVPPTSEGAATSVPGIKTVFVILMENHDWSQIAGNPSAPYINKTLLTQGAHAEHYFNPPKLHPSEPNYIWLEAGDNLGLTTDVDPSASHSLPVGTDHLVAQLERAGKSWRSYQEDIPIGVCPIQSAGLYGAKHNPMVFFQDVSGSPPSPSNAGCMQNVRPLSELANDLRADQDADYNFITPNLCNDMHGASGCPSDRVKTGDDWLAATIPTILASEAYKDAGAIFITWDESEHGDHPIGMIVLSEFARAGHASSVAYTHSSALRTFEDIFSVPALRGAGSASSLLDLFQGTSTQQPGAGSVGVGDGGLTPDGHTLPSPKLTPGGTFPNVDTQAVCSAGYSSRIRSVTSAEKAQVAAAYGYNGPSSGVEYDHLVSLELGGSNDFSNLWPEPLADAHVKDRLENYLHVKICSGAMSIADVQTRIATNWVQLWKDVGQP